MKIELGYQPWDLGLGFKVFIRFQNLETQKENIVAFILEEETKQEDVLKLFQEALAKLLPN
jgi:hypothetical protein